MHALTRMDAGDAEAQQILDAHATGLVRNGLLVAAWGIPVVLGVVEERGWRMARPARLRKDGGTEWPSYRLVSGVGNKCVKCGCT